MSNLTAELNSLDFSAYIGGPLQAAIQAQTAASMAQVGFIESVGFNTDSSGKKSINYTEFSYKKSVPTADGSGFEDQDAEIKVPFISMINVPSLRISKMSIDFNAKLTSVETANTSSEFSGNAEVSASFRRINLKAAASYKRTSSSGLTEEKTYNMAVHVEAVNDEIPAGLDRILSLLGS